MPRIIDDREFAARLRLRRLQIVALIATGVALGLVSHYLEPLAEALADNRTEPVETRTLPDGEPLELRAAERLRNPPSP